MQTIGGYVIKLDGYYDSFSVPSISPPWGKYDIREIHVANGDVELLGVYMFLGGTWGGKVVNIGSYALTDAPQHVRDEVERLKHEQRNAPR